MSEKVKGGLADGLKDSAFNKNNIRKGMKVEREHTNDPAVAKEIAKDHLKEDPEYYQKLEKIEKRAAMAMSRAKLNRVVGAVLHRSGLSPEHGTKVKGLIRRIEQDPYTSSIGVVRALRSKIKKGGDPHTIKKLEEIVKRHKERG